MNFDFTQFMKIEPSTYQICLIALIPVALATILYLVEKKTKFGKVNYAVRQTLYGILFGYITIFATEYGVIVNGATVNCRDASVLTSGLLFGAPSGIIAGIIGGLHRFVTPEAGDYTRIACSVSTALAGLYAGALRKYMFENKKPSIMLSLAIGVVMEVFHLTMVFITNMDTAERAMSVVAACTIPMVLANGISVMLSTISVSIISHEKKKVRKAKKLISQTVQRWLLLAVLIAFTFTTLFVASLQQQLSDTQAQKLLEIAIDTVSDDIRDASDNALISIAKEVKDRKEDLSLLTEEFDIEEINKIDKAGIIFESNIEENIGFNMATAGEQSQEFMLLVSAKEELAQEYGPIARDHKTMRKYAGVRTDYGYLQVGYDSEHYFSAINAQMNNLTKNRKVGETGYIIILDENINLVSMPTGINEHSFDDVKNKNVEVTNGTIIETVNGEECICKVGMVEGYYIVSVLPQAEAYKLRNIAVYVNTFMEILVFGLLFAFVYFIIKYVVVVQIKKINRSLAKISDGDLNVEVNVRSNEEFASLSDDINSTVDTLKKYISEASARIDKELEFAKNIQASALPNVFPAFPKRKEFDIYATMHTAKEVGGDFYDFYLTDNNVNFLVADVSGKGIPAAMFMMRAKTQLKTLTEHGETLDNVFTIGNRELCEGNDAGMFVTAWQGSLDYSSGKLNFVNAGHNPPLIYRAREGKFEYLKRPAGFVLAGMDIVKYKANEIELEKGDIVYLYTDGVTEATNSNNELFGEDRLLETVNSQEFDDMKALCEKVKQKVDEFVGEAPQFDDITMVALKYFGKAEPAVISFDRASIEDIPAVTEFAEAEFEKMDCPMKTVIQLNVAIDEIYSNIAKFAYKDGKGPVSVEITREEDPNAVAVTFIDEGRPYNPLTKEDPDITLSAEERGIGGLGIYMVKKTMDDMQYKYVDNKNILIIKKNLGE